MKNAHNTSASVFGKITLITLVCFVFLVMALHGNAQTYPFSSLSGTGTTSVRTSQFQAPQMMLAPNVAHTGVQVMLGYTLYGNNTVSIIITDLAGNAISRDDVAFGAGRFNWLINTNMLNAGTYIIKVINGPSIETRPLTII